MDAPRPPVEERVPFENGRILVPTDFSTCAEQAYDYALALAAEYGATVQLLHVVTVYGPEMYGAVEDAPDDALLRERIEEEGERQLSEWAERGEGRGVAVEKATRRRLSVPRAILEAVEASGSDLIVLGTHGRGRLGRFFLGSVAQRVLRRAPVPVLTVREPGEGESEARATPRAIERVLVPTDFSEPAARAVRVACLIADRHGAALDLLHVVKPIPFPASVSLGAGSFYDYLPDLSAAVEQELTRIAEDAGCSPDRAAQHVEEGRPARVIVEAATSFGTDLIVMASRGQSRLERLFLGSVTERVIRRAACPVLTVRAPKRAQREDRVDASEDAMRRSESP